MRQSKTDRAWRKTARLRCAECGADIAYDPSAGSCGRLEWRMPQDLAQPISDLPRVVCCECSNARSHIADFDIKWIAGLRALPALLCVLRDFRWTEAARERLGEIMIELSLLPTSDGDKLGLFNINQAGQGACDV